MAERSLDRAPNHGARTGGTAGEGAKAEETRKADMALDLSREAKAPIGPRRTVRASRHDRPAVGELVSSLRKVIVETDEVVIIPTLWPPEAKAKASL